MVTFITGKNASGKTLYLYNMYKNDVNLNGISKSVCNLEDYTSYKNIPLDKELVNVTADLMYEDALHVINNMVIGIADLDREKDYSQNMYIILSLILKDVPNVYLDDPEINLSQSELLVIGHVLSYIQRHCKKNIWVVTRSIDLVDLSACRLVTVRNNELIEEPDLFELLL